MNEKSLSDRILSYSLAASVVINLAWIAIVSRSDIFGAAASFTQLHEKKIKVFKPIPQKPKPKKELPPPPPPKPPKVPPKIQPLKHIKPLPPRTAPRPTPRTPQPTPPIHVAYVPHTVATGSHSSQGTVYVPPSSGETGTPATTTEITPPAHVDPPPPHVDPPPPAHVDPPPAHVDPPPPAHVDPPPPIHKEGWKQVDTQEASPLGDYSSPEVSEEDGVAGKTITVSWTINEKGRATNVHITQRSGNAEVDRKCEDIIKAMHFQPAIQDHYFQEAHMSHDFGF